MQPFTRLTLTAGGIHFADQLALAALPFAVIAAGGGATATGSLIAAHSAAWLVLTLPAGLYTDRLDRRWLMRAACGITAAAGLLGALAAAAGQTGALALTGFATASGTVIFTLAAMAHVPTLLPPDRRLAGNARLELARALATLAAPALAGAIAARGGVAPILLLAAGAAAMTMSLPGRLPAGDPAIPRQNAWLAVREGAAQVWRVAMLRAVAACAIFWNLGFFALLAGFVPYATEQLGLGMAATGIALGAVGAGQVLAAALASGAARRVGTGVVLLFGPGVSALAGGMLLASPFAPMPLIVAAAALGLLGFGPMLWLIGRNTLVQATTPPALLGRVNATMQVTVFGMRPLGALAGAAMAACFGAGATILFAALNFIAAFGVMLFAGRPGGAAISKAGCRPRTARSPHAGHPD